MQEEISRLHADVAAHTVGLLQNGLPLADCDDGVRRGEGEQLAEPPDTAKIERVAAVAPTCLELAEGSGDGNAVPFVIHVQ